jgi:tetratricopeptide (TPR) repeat protein
MIKRRLPADHEAETPVDAAAVRAALEDVTSSEEFATSPRLQEILRYIVEEMLAGRGGQIRGKTIASDVYGRDPDGSGATDNIVRVEARRLRRLLVQYYNGSGQNDPLLIHIDPGGYVPRFESRTISKAPPGIDADPAAEPVPAVENRHAGSAPKYVMLGIVVVLAFVLIGGATAWRTGDRQQSDTAGLDSQQAAIRTALATKSPVSVQSLNLAEQARGMLFPLFEIQRQKLALQMFDHAIALDDTLPDGYAGKAQVLGTLAVLTLDERKHQELLRQADSVAKKGLEVAPTNARAHAAAAWVTGISGDHITARKHADIAVGLMPNDGFILDIDGVVALLGGDGQRAAIASHPERVRLGGGRFGAVNIWGAANYLLGHYDTTVKVYRATAESGDPVSAPSLIMLAAALDYIGNSAEARATVGQMNESWPNFPVTRVVTRMIGDHAVVRDIIDRLVKNGLVLEDPASKNSG